MNDKKILMTIQDYCFKNEYEFNIELFSLKLTKIVVDLFTDKEFTLDMLTTAVQAQKNFIIGNKLNKEKLDLFVKGLYRELKN
jgi:hypothetical protein